MSTTQPMAKSHARAAIRSRRARRTPEELGSAGEALAAAAAAFLIGGPTTITAYLSMPAEPPTDRLVENATGMGHTVLVPRIRGRELDWVPARSDSAFGVGPMGIREPLGSSLHPSALREAAVMFVPGLAVDRNGRRLGQGGGYYDRVLADVPPVSAGGPMIVAVLFEDELLDEVPFEPHDCRVDAAITPRGTTWFR